MRLGHSGCPVVHMLRSRPHLRGAPESSERGSLSNGPTPIGRYTRQVQISTQDRTHARTNHETNTRTQTRRHTRRRTPAQTNQPTNQPHTQPRPTTFLSPLRLRAPYTVLCGWTVSCLALCKAVDSRTCTCHNNNMYMSCKHERLLSHVSFLSGLRGHMAIHVMLCERPLHST